ncbi:hypothetical protein ABPG75_010806 [Micractinium tetrahymenae]
MIICLGPVCVPVHLLLAFLVGVAHQHGYLRWFKREWVMFSWWRRQFARLVKGEQEAAANAAAQHGAAKDEGEQDGCAGGACCAGGGTTADATANEGGSSSSGSGGGSLRSRGAKDASG